MRILHRCCVPIAWVLGLLVLCYTARTPALERWFYVNDNLWEDENVSNLARSGKDGQGESLIVGIFSPERILQISSSTVRLSCRPHINNHKAFYSETHARNQGLSIGDGDRR